MKIEYYNAKTILVRNNNPANWFGVHHNINVYRGCQHDCIYCDSRSDCFHIQNFNDLIIKINAAELLDKELSKKRRKVTIGTGSMSDPYIPAEKHLKITEKILKVVFKHKYPFHITTKSDLILRDIEILKEISKIFLSVCLTITTTNDKLASIIEPKAPSPSKRLFTIENLTKNNIFTGVLFQPVLPYILDNYDNIKKTVEDIADAGGKFIIPWFGLTMRKGQREYFLEKLEQHFPGLKEKYMSNYKTKYICNSENAINLYRFFENECKKKNIIYKMSDIKNYQKYNPYKQMTIFDMS